MVRGTKFVPGQNLVVGGVHFVRSEAPPLSMPEASSLLVPRERRILDRLKYSAEARKNATSDSHLDRATDSCWDVISPEVVIVPAASRSLSCMDLEGPV